MIWALWVCVYMINNGLVTWLPTLYRQVFQLPLQTSLAYGWITSGVGVVASIVCALLIDKVGRKPWYAIAFLLATLPLLVAVLARRHLGDGGADPRDRRPTRSCRPSRSRSTSTRPSSIRRACARSAPASAARGCEQDRRSVRSWSARSSADLGIRYVFAAFAAVALVGGLVTLLFAIETKGRVLEELSP